MIKSARTEQKVQFCGSALLKIKFHGSNFIVACSRGNLTCRRRVGEAITAMLRGNFFREIQLNHARPIIRASSPLEGMTLLHTSLHTEGDKPRG